MKKVVLLAFVLVLLSMSVGFTKPVEASGTIYIRADGSVEGTTHISTVDNVTYTFTDNINDSIVVERDNIVVDGAGYTLQGTGSGRGINLAGRSNVTIKNMRIQNFLDGIYLRDSSNNTISGNNMTNNEEGIYLEYSSNNTISGNNITNNDYGIELAGSSNNSIYGNNITNNGDGIYIYGSFSNNTISGNNITANTWNGIVLEVSSNNTISGNSITNNGRYGVFLFWSTSNIIYHNNFVNNTQQVHFYVSGYANVWDDGVEGNYWSNYTGVDSNHDGIGDSPHVIDANNTDYFPLMGMFHSFNTPLGYNVNVISNSTIEDFTFFESNSTIKMYVSNMTITQTFGFCRVCIPKGLISPPYEVIINDGLTEVLYFNETIYDNGTHRWIYFAYEHSTHEVIIIPEVPTWTSMLLILIVLTAAIAFYKRRPLKTPIH